MSNDYIKQVSNMYIELYENIIGERFIKANSDDLINRIEKNVAKYLNSY